MDVYKNYSSYLTQIQYNSICKYWRIINKLNSQIENFDYSMIHKTACVLCTFDSNSCTICLSNNPYIKLLNKLKGKLQYYQEEYEKYITKSGFKFSDQTQDEALFQLINNGI